MSRRDRPRGQEQLAGAGGADRVDEPPQPGVRVDDAEPRRRHPELRARRTYAQVAGERELQPAAERVPAHRGHDRHLDGVQRRQRRLERVREQLRRLLGEALRRSDRRCRSRPRRRVPAPVSDDAASVELRAASRRGPRGSARSSALRLAALSIVTRATPSAGVSTVIDPTYSRRRGRRPRRRPGPPRRRSPRRAVVLGLDGISIFIDSMISDRVALRTGRRRTPRSSIPCR